VKCQYPSCFSNFEFCLVFPRCIVLESFSRPLPRQEKEQILLKFYMDDKPIQNGKQTQQTMNPTTANNPKAPPTVRVTTIPDWRDAIAGFCAGAFSRSLLAPVERVKLLLQLQGSTAMKHQTKPAATNPAATTTTTNTTTSSPPATTVRKTARQVVRQVYYEQGLASFWRGNVPNVLRFGGQSGLNFMLMDYYKRLAVSPTLHSWLETVGLEPRATNTEAQARRRQQVTSFVSGGLAGGTATTVLYPVEFLRTRLAMDQGATVATRTYPNGMRDVLIQTLRSDGITGLYQGYGIALFGGVVFRVIFMGGYDALKTEIELHKANSNHNNSSSSTGTTKAAALTWGERFAVAQCISLTAGTLCYPIDSVRRRMMMQAGQPLHERLYRGSLHCFRVVWAQEGLRGFYLGIAPNIVRSVGGALMLVVYDVLKSMR
jgi:solute carrier family 25 (mitochondrial adenine nucleotide translocator), member 4/5/6/31